ncbi:hypothetical protein DRH14_03695 [Candidatus Shapirobacteria bacterium]|nr:MAG: hypothetical protein DRH14_03695 [Candidatus Shapirobacteria bacterium]
MLEEKILAHEEWEEDAYSMYKLDEERGQVFLSPSSTIEVVGVAFRITSEDGPGQLKARIYKVNPQDYSGLPDLLLGESNTVYEKTLPRYTPNDLPREDQWVYFEFPEPVVLEPSTYYAVTVAITRENKFFWVGRTSNKIPGRAIAKYGTGSIWKGHSSYDVTFQIWARRKGILKVKDNCGGNVPILVNGQETETFYEKTFDSGTEVTIQVPKEVILPLRTSSDSCKICSASSSYTIRREGRKGFFAKNLFWQFYVTSDAKLYYRTSKDGKSWSDAIFIRDTNYKYGCSGQVFFDGEYVHITVKDGIRLYYRIGIPQEDGTIEWLNDWQIAHQAPQVSTYGDHHFYVRDDGIPWTIWCYGSYVGSMRPRVTTSSVDPRKEGKWETPSGYPKKVWISDYLCGGAQALIIQTSGKEMMLFHYQNQAEIISFKTSNGTFDVSKSYLSSVHSPVEQYHTGLENWHIDVLRDKDENIHLVFEDINKNIRHRVYLSSLGYWLPEETLATSPSVEADPMLCLDPESGNVYCFMAHVPTKDHLSYRVWYSKTKTWGPLIDWINEEEYGLPERPSDHQGGNLICWRRAWNGLIGLTYLAKGPSGLEIKFKYLDLRQKWKWKFKQWSDGDTSPTKTVTISSSVTLEAIYDPVGPVFEETIKPSTFLRLIKKSPGGVFKENIRKKIEHPLREKVNFKELFWSVLGVPLKVSVRIFKRIYKAFILLKKFYVRRRND